jgi:hypothetical protein
MAVLPFDGREKQDEKLFQNFIDSHIGVRIRCWLGACVEV